MKSVLGGTFAIVASAIVAGPAFGSFVPNQQGSPPQQVHQPAVTSGADAIPLDVLHTMGTQYLTQDVGKATVVPGYTDFPNALRLQSALTASERRQLDAAVARVEQAGSSSQDKAKASSVPGYTDFPNVFRLHATLTPAERTQLDAAAAGTSSVSTSGGGDFSWGDASIGIGIGLAIAAGLAIVAFAGTRRNRATPVPA
jgi:hypothetical protein